MRQIMFIALIYAFLMCSLLLIGNAPKSTGPPKTEPTFTAMPKSKLLGSRDPEPYYGIVPYTTHTILYHTAETAELLALSHVNF